MVESERLNIEIATKTLEKVNAPWYKQIQVWLAIINIIAAVINGAVGVTIILSQHQH